MIPMKKWPKVVAMEYMWWIGSAHHNYHPHCWLEAFQHRYSMVVRGLEIAEVPHLMILL